MTDRCPGSGYQMDAMPLRERPRWPDYRMCPFCRRGYAVNYDGKIRAHKGLPRRPDGGCPYTCDPSCDFSCYGPKEGA